MNNKYGAKYAFLYLLSLISLIFLGISVGIIVFGIIDLSVFDPLSRSYYRNTDSFKFAISAILISAPVYFLSLRQILKGLKKKELDYDSQIRRWLTYLIILISAVIILGVFVAIINSFLSGGLSTKFILKSITVFIISALVFSYYFYDIKQDEEKKGKGKNKTRTFFLLISLIVILSAFISSWFYIESPRETRMRNLDNSIVNNITSLESLVNNYYQENGELPKELTDIKDLNYYDEDIFINPETREEIEFNILSENEFEFCTEFMLASDKDIKGRPIEIRNNYNNRVVHESGYDCIEGELWLNDNNIKARI
ncbi:MAG: DUF5671 domain-containing protein [Patescibacteria group bacterium]|jgi:uncharacterized protein YueI|nr:DUF5671 domain-containing protein [Patescibacteria group bacterium]